MTRSVEVGTSHTVGKPNVVSRAGRLARAGTAIRARARIGWCTRRVVRWLDTGVSETFTETEFNKLFRAYRSDEEQR
jgi:hypothetical protein